MIRKREDILFKGPELDLRPEDDKAFEQLRDRIAANWRFAGYDRKAEPWLERTIYELGEHLLTHDLFDELVAPRLAKLSSRGRSRKRNHFNELIRVVFADRGNAPSRAQRSRMANRLYCAYWHFIPAEFLRGFLKEIGTYPKRKVVQDGFEAWLVCALREHRNSELRRKYPKRIRKLVEGKQHIRKWREEADG